MYWMDLGTEVTALSSQIVPFSQVVLKAGFTVIMFCVLQLCCRVYGATVEDEIDEGEAPVGEENGSEEVADGQGTVQELQWW